MSLLLLRERAGGRRGDQRRGERGGGGESGEERGGRRGGGGRGERGERGERRDREVGRSCLLSEAAAQSSGAGQRPKIRITRPRPRAGSSN